MKAYERFVVWLDYLDSERKRSEGRRVPLNSCVRSPTVDELAEACKRLKLDIQRQTARYPRSPTRQSGFVSVKKGGPKQKLLLALAHELSKIRGEKPTHQPKKV